MPKIYAQPTNAYIDTTSKLQQLALGKAKLDAIPREENRIQQAHSMNMKTKGLQQAELENRARRDFYDDVGQMARWAMAAKTPEEQKQRLNQGVDFYVNSGNGAAERFRDRADLLPLMGRLGS